MRPTDLIEPDRLALDTAAALRTIRDRFDTARVRVRSWDLPEHPTDAKR